MEIACHTEPAATDVFTHVVAPWVDAASARLRDELTALPTTAVDPSALVASCAERLSRRLVRLVTPSLVHELSQMRDHFERYPVLARELDRERDTAVEVTAEIAARYAADQAELTDAVLDAKSALVAVRPEGDRHQGGRATTILELADGQLVVYKPRGVDAHLAFARVVALVNDVTGLDLATVGAVASNGYGWTEHVEPAPLPTADATRYFERLGGLLAVLHLVRATDMHHQNVIARAGQPLLIDVETLFQAQLSVERPDPAADALARSVARTGILPAVAGRYGLADISAVGGDNDETTSTANRPTCAGQPVEAADHADAVRSGFRLVYDVISQHSVEFAAVLATCASVPVRVVPRPTRQYVDLIAATRGPELLRDPATRLRALVAACATDFLPGLAELEAAELDAGDVPLFTARADSRDLESRAGTLPGVLATSGLEDALENLAKFDEFDRDDQEWVIAAALATRRVALTGGGPGHVQQHAVGTDEVLSAACAVADRIVTASFGCERMNWIGLEPVGDTRWLVLPMGAGLAHGYTGVALFLAQLGRITSVRRYSDVARRALDSVPDLLAVLRANPDLIAAVGSDALTGFGGIGYALTRLAVLLDDKEVAGWADETVPLAAAAAELEPEHPHGPAGPALWCQHGCSEWTDDDLSLCHGELGRVDVSVTGLSAATRHRRTGEVLATLRREGPRCVTPDRVPTPGLLTGLAGIGYGLLRLGFPEQTPSVLLHH